jgi:hypothetical protein
MFVTRFPLVVALAFCSLLILVSPSAAISDGGVSGTITMDGQPVAGGKIAFHREDGQFVGTKFKDGMYKVDRVPAGTLTVTLDGKGVPLKYASEDTSGLVVQVRGDVPNRIDFDVTTPKPN